MEVHVFSRVLLVPGMHKYCATAGGVPDKFG